MPLELTTPAPLTDIIDATDARTPIGSAMRSADWQRVPAGLRAGAVFSAAVESSRYLSALKDGISSIVARARTTGSSGQPMWQQDRSKLIRDLRVLGESLGIPHPDAKRGADGSIKEKDIRDPLSIARLKLVVNTQMEMAYGHADYLTATDPAILDEFPAWEMVRISPRAIPRNWPARWISAGGTIHGARMIALKTSPVWSKLSRFGNPFPPFDYNSGMGVEDIGRDEAEQLGIIKPGERIKADPPADFRESLKASITNLDQSAKQFLKEQLGDQIQFTSIDGEGDVAQWNPDGKPPGRKTEIRKQKTEPKPKPKPQPQPQPAPAPTPPPPKPRTLADVHADLAPLGDEHAQISAKIKDAVKSKVELSRNGYYGSDAYNAAVDEEIRLRAELKPIIEKARAAIELPEAQRGKVNLLGGNAGGVKNFIGGRDIVERLVHPDNMPAIKVEVKAGRADCKLDGTIRVRPDQTPSVIAHEITHAIEFQHADVMKASQDFLRSRRGPKEKPKKLGTIHPGHGYGASEITIEDEWEKRGGNAYSGKLYHHGVGNAALRKIWAANMAVNPAQAFSQLYATEVLTMGIERLHADPLAFAREDREYFDFVISTLQKLAP